MSTVPKKAARKRKEREIIREKYLGSLSALRVRARITAGWGLRSRAGRWQCFWREIFSVEFTNWLWSVKLSQSRSIPKAVRQPDRLPRPVLQVEIEEEGNYSEWFRRQRRRTRTEAIFREPDTDANRLSRDCESENVIVKGRWRCFNDTVETGYGVVICKVFFLHFYHVCNEHYMIISFANRRQHHNRSLMYNCDQGLIFWNASPKAEDGSPAGLCLTWTPLDI